MYLEYGEDVDVLVGVCADKVAVQLPQEILVVPQH